ELPAFAASAAAVTATVTSVTAFSTGTSAACACAIGARTGFIHRNRPAAEIGAVERLDRSACLAVICHLDEGKAASAAGVLIGRDADLAYAPVLGKQFTQLLLVSLKWKVTDK